MISTQREKRVRRPRQIFSPSDNTIGPTHFLLHFDSTDSYTIALSSSINNITDNTATINVRGKKILATIITSGTLESCEEEQKKRTRESQQSFIDTQYQAFDSDEDEVLDIDLSSQQEGVIHTFSSSTRQSTAHSTQRPRFFSNDENIESTADDDDDDEYDNLGGGRTSRSGGTSNIAPKPNKNKKKRKRAGAERNNAKRQRKNVVNSTRGEGEQVNLYVAPDIINEMNCKDMLKQVENHIELFQNHLNKVLGKMEKKLDYYLGSNLSQGSNGLNQYRTGKGEVFPTEYMHGTTNLLSTSAKDLVDFSRKTLKILFTAEELKTRLLPPQRDHLKRRTLDEERFNKMIEATRLKFRLDSDMMQQCFKDLLRAKLSNFLYEERRRENRRRLRNQQRLLKRNVLQQNLLDHQENVSEEEEEEGEETNR